NCLLLSRLIVRNIEKRILEVSHCENRPKTYFETFSWRKNIVFLILKLFQRESSFFSEFETFLQ
ncbi:hypothetical protein, partial [Parabacteroides leei]|uniref:hypothetical protein n=1 Tax=Parabacteroides leei TaxID=2939491 RepID=UPI0032424DE8